MRFVFELKNRKRIVLKKNKADVQGITDISEKNETAQICETY